MSQPGDRGDEALQPRIFSVENDADQEPVSPSPRVFASEQTGPIAPPEPYIAKPSGAEEPKPERKDRGIRWGAMFIAAAIVGWLLIDAYLWISSAFAFSTGLGVAASAVTVAAIVGICVIIMRELRSLFSLRNVEANQALLEDKAGEIRPEQRQAVIRTVLEAVPRDKETIAAIEAFQRQSQRHHTPVQQAELLSRTVMAPLDRRAEAVVRRATARAFAITAFSPTAITDVLLFVAIAVRMVRGVAACYGHRPTAAATVHLLRRLLLDAGKLGAVDIAGATLTQMLGGAVMERVAANAAQSMYAGQRAARLGLATMAVCRPVPFKPQEVPGIFSSLVGNLFSRKTEANDPMIGRS